MLFSIKQSVSHSVVSDSLQPHGLQPTRLLRPWDFADKNTGVSCHFLLYGKIEPYFKLLFKMASEQGSESHSVMSDSLQPHALQPSRLLCLWDFPGKNTGVGCHFLLQGIFLTQGSNPHLLCLLHWQAGTVPPGKSMMLYYPSEIKAESNSYMQVS